MKRIAILFLAVALASCGTFKKHSTKEEQKSITKVDSSALVVTQTTKKVDTSVSIKGSQQYASKPVDNILKGDSLVLDNEQQRIVVDYDPTTGNIRAQGKVKDLEQRIQLNETTVTATQSQKSVETEQEAKKITKDSVKENDQFAWGVAFTMIGVLMLIIIILLMLSRSTR